ncbi:hypothetical protein [Catelliglobosispora koreensis]|uniref:hypothetical protein n=1 Tax=Catelliglobosispora koreensis TaxID=129052 RepID=UPI00037ED0C0|nr:hypothetical protein [Catelliglobosispora koreensis]
MTATAIEEVTVVHLWWNGVDRTSRDCAYVSAGTLPDGRWLVQHDGYQTKFEFDYAEDAVSVARHMTLGWASVPVRFRQPLS